MWMKKTDTRTFVPPLPLARPTASRTQAFRATALREVRRRPPTVVRPGMFVPHFSQRRTVSRGACICSSASRSRRRFPTAAAAPPAPALPIARWRTCSIVAAPFGRPTAMSIERRHPSARRRPRPIIAWRAPQVGRFIFPIVAAPFGLPTAMPIERRHPAAAERPRPIIAWRAPQVGRFIFPIVAAPLGRPTAMSIERRHPAAAERPRRVSPRQRGTHAPSFFPTCDVQEANLFI